MLTTYLTTGEVQDSVVEVFPTYTECLKAADQQKIEGSCYPVEKIIHQGEETPAGY
ncbi:hypothetical protein CKS_4282 [Pantoea stewartii subsp. stewartii DC283]|uniref:DUF1482 family protein n=1 Tax=Pantoea stewartii subsp. stewartii DC283 TaxID=660596 RepID=H3RC19_PANSE|nr:hypothetical protein CKS_4282 [Pantoea stewartii subsp. stewartii DC283]